MRSLVRVYACFISTFAYTVTRLQKIFLHASVVCPRLLVYCSVNACSELTFPLEKMRRRNNCLRMRGCLHPYVDFKHMQTSE